jgi:quercetin dioxygenase-like cupin family protein
MHGRFLLGSDLEKESLEWGDRRWFSLPEITQSKHLVVVEVTLQPGFGHNFHYHPNQEEMVFVLDGEIVHWLEQEKTVLKAGDSVFIPDNVVHASLNVSNKPVHVLAILGPAVGVEGYEVIEVGDQSPWNMLHKA